MRRPARFTAVVSGLLAVALLSSACSSERYVASGEWREKPEVGNPGSIPEPQVPGAPPPPETGAPGEEGDPNVIATNLEIPWGIALLPDGTGLVGEKNTGRIMHVFPDRTPAQPLMTVPGIDPTGDGGLLGLAVAPTYPEDKLIYAYISTPTENQVVRFAMGGTPTPILTGIPKGATHNGGQIGFGPDGHLFVGTGDAGNPALAQDPKSLAGKILRMDIFGEPVPDNPDPTSVVFSSGHSNVTGLCIDPLDGSLYDSEGGQGSGATGGEDEINLVQPSGNYGYPSNAQGTDPAASFPAAETGIAGCVAINGSVIVAALDGQKLLVSVLGPGSTAGAAPEEVLVKTYGRLRSLTVDSQGGLWITTSNRDGIGTPAADDDKVIRIPSPVDPSGGGIT